MTEAIYDAGGRFDATSTEVSGMKRSEYRAGGANAEIRYAIGQCSLGSILVAASSKGICAISLGDDPDALVRDLKKGFPNAPLIRGGHAFEQIIEKVINFVEDPSAGSDLPLDVRGTAFQQRVWQALQAIPPGQTISYAELARRLGAPKAVRAVGAACAANSIAVAIPCHRVVGANGALSGYRWGVERKRRLIEKERAHN